MTVRCCKIIQERFSKTNSLVIKGYYLRARQESMALFPEISGVPPNGHTSGSGAENFSKVRLSITQISFVYQVFIFLLQTTANNSHGCRVYVKKIASTISSTYIVVALPAPRCGSGTHRKWSRLRLCHTLQSGLRGWLCFVKFLRSVSWEHLGCSSS